MSDSVFDVNSIAAVIAGAPCRDGMYRSDTHFHSLCEAAAIVAWLDERIVQVGRLGQHQGHPYLRFGSMLQTEQPVYRIVQPEDQQ